MAKSAKPTASTPTKSPSTSATLDTFLSSSASSTKRSAAPPLKPSPPKKQKTTHSKYKNGKAKPTTKSKPKPNDNRNLGTLDLLDSSADEQDATQAGRDPGGSGNTKTRPIADGKGKSGAAQLPSATSSAKQKGKQRMTLEEEDWLMDSEPAGPPRGFSPDVKGEKSNRRQEEKPSLPGGEKQVRRSPPCCAPEVHGEGDRSETLTLKDTDDEVEIVGRGGVEQCECGTVLEGMDQKARDAHLSSCSSQSSNASSTSISKLSLLAPLSRLFSLPTSSTSTSTKPSTSIPLSASTSASAAKKMGGVLSALPNAFTALMAGHAETKQWKAAEESDKKKGRLPAGEKRGVPFYKWIDGMEVTVDAFRYGKVDGCKAYFLSHAHSDHYQNLSSSWSGGPIYASLTTINLIKLKLNVKDEYLFPLPLDQTIKVHGIDVTLIDANHCPGSVLFLFEGPHTDPKSPWSKTPDKIFRYLHCGDFRASPEHILHPSLSYPSKKASRTSTFSTSIPMSSSLSTDTLPSHLIQKPLNAIYLDTTYLSPSYCFPAQELVIQACAELVKERVESGEEGVLWRADGREGERKGLKGWLGAGIGVKAEGGGRREEAEREALVEMTPLPEEEEVEGNEDSADGGEGREEAEEVQQAFADSLPMPGDEEEGEQEEEAWLAAHSPALGREGGTMATQFEGVEPGVAPLREEECEPKPKMEELEGNGDVPYPSPALVGPEEDELVEDGGAKAEEEEQKPTVAPKTEDGGDDKPDLKPDLKPDIKPDMKPSKERLLVMVGTYSIGKERIVKAIAHSLSTKIFSDARKKALFLAQDDPDLHSLLTDDPLEAQVHVGWLSDISREALQEYLGKYSAKRVEGGFTKVIGLRPTGWTYRAETKDKNPSIPKILALEQQRKFSPAGLYPQRDSTPLTMAFGVPYSEHSSFFELTCFCLSLDYQRIIPTVNVHTASSRDKMRQWIDKWAAEKKRRKDMKLPRVVPFRSVKYW
ncbi:hypothetical protein JCM11641_007395 [Rhodosporidiobolus odoratus]